MMTIGASIDPMIILYYSHLLQPVIIQMLLEQEEKYLWIAFSVLGIVIFLVIGLSYYFWKRRRITESRRRPNEIQKNIQNSWNINNIRNYSSQKHKEKSLRDIKNTAPNSNDDTNNTQKEHENALQDSVELNRIDPSHYKNQGLDIEVSLPSIESNMSMDSMRQYAKLPGKKSIPGIKY